MINPIAWYVTITLVGWIAFPLMARLLPALADRGYSLARAAGLLIWAYAFWLLASLGLAQNDAGGILLGLLVLLGLSAWALGHRDEQGGFREHLEALRRWLQDHLRTVLAVEGLFLVFFVFMLIVRAANPESVGTEKPMELAFINAILRSPTFPPHDPWLSGYAISYYYFGYVMAAMLARITATPGAVAFNLMLALLFGLNAAGAFGVIHNLLAAWRKSTGSAARPAPIAWGFLGPVFLLLVSNFEALLEVLHRRGLFWTWHSDGTASSAFWRWLDIRDLTEAPSAAAGWLPERYWWWWRASRVVQDYDLAGQWSEVIDEFPFFSYLLGDLHPHVLAMPFGLLAIGIALNLYLGGWRGETNLLGLRLPVRPAGMAFAALSLGGLAFLNTWDFPIYTALLCGALLLEAGRARGWGWQRAEEVVKFVLPLAGASILLYLPFYVGFSSQAGGILPNLVSPTRGAHLWVMFGTLLIPLLAYLGWLAFSRQQPAGWKAALLLTLGGILFLWLFSWLLGYAASLRDPQFAAGFLASQGSASIGEFFAAANARRLEHIGGLATLALVIALSLSLLLGRDRSAQAEESPAPGAAVFVALLGLVGALLVLAPEFVYLRDQFGTRMNTVFKFYYQGWLLWSLAAAFGTAVLFESTRGIRRALLGTGLALAAAAGLLYPLMSLPEKTNGFTPARWTLDASAHLDSYYPDDAAAIRWLRAAPPGIIAEAVGDSYSDFGRAATYSGMPAVLGWPMHEGQWRGTYAPQGSRKDDILRLFSTPDWNEARAILEKYDVRYVFVGTLERNHYSLKEDKFRNFLKEVFRQGRVVIYAVP